jgi:hypothetical protein
VGVDLAIRDINGRNVVRSFLAFAPLCLNQTSNHEFRHLSGGQPNGALRVSDQIASASADKKSHIIRIKSFVAGFALGAGLAVSGGLK